MIPDAFIQDLLSHLDIVEVVGRYVQLRKGGSNLLGLCPFHQEKTPSFTVSPAKQFYHCFGCGAHGSAITFLIEHTGASFPEVVHMLAASVGMVVPQAHSSAHQRLEFVRRQEEQLRYIQVLEIAQAFYAKQLRTAAAAIQYLKQRGVTGKMAHHFGLGWASGNRQGLAQVFSAYEDAVLVEAGLVIEAEDGRRYDRFRERVMFPIRNAKGSLIGFGGRILGKGEPKYLNSPETPVFSKGKELYGLCEARSAIRAAGHVIVVEGYLDVVGLAQFGIGQVVATLGCATSSDHVNKLLRLSDRVIFSFDGDQAGRRAAWRALQACLPLLRDDITLRFLFLPAEHDPDSYVRTFGAAAFQDRVSEAMALSCFLLEELSSRHNLAEAEGRAACLHDAKSLITAIPLCGLRTQIERELGKLVHLTPQEVTAALVQEEALAMSFAGGPAGRAKGEAAGFTPRRAGDVEHSFAVPGATPFLSHGTQSGPDQIALQHTALGRWRSNSIDSGQYRRPEKVSALAKAVPTMAHRLLRLLGAHPELVDSMGDLQFEVLDRMASLHLVRDLIVLIHHSGARHLGALLAAVEPATDLEAVLRSMRADLLSEEDLPDPQAEWEDALQRIEFTLIKEEMDELVQTGLKDAQARVRYQELSRRLARLKCVDGSVIE